jgi:hypothetical protein
VPPSLIASLILSELRTQCTHSGARRTSDDGPLQAASENGSQNSSPHATDDGAFAGANATTLVGVTVTAFIIARVAFIVALPDLTTHTLIVGIASVALSGHLRRGAKQQRARQNISM